MTHQPTTVTTNKNNKNTQSNFDSSLGSCDVSVAPRSGRLSSSSSTQLLLLPKGNSEVPCFFVSYKLPPLRMQAYTKLQPGSTVLYLWFCYEYTTLYSIMAMPLCVVLLH